MIVHTQTKNKINTTNLHKSEAITCKLQCPLGATNSHKSEALRCDDRKHRKTFDSFLESRETKIKQNKVETVHCTVSTVRNSCKLQCPLGATDSLAHGYTYTNTDVTYIVRSSLTSSFRKVHVVCDKDWVGEEGEQISIRTYFNNAHTMFTDRIKKLGTADHAITINEEKELRFMFDALLYAKGLLSDKKGKKY